MKNVRRRAVMALSALLALFAITITCAIPAIAADAPDSITISNVMAFRHLAETNDTLIMFHYDMPYPSDNWSDIPASRGIMFRLKNSSGDVLQTGSPFVFSSFDSHGYGDGNGAFYLTASENFTWESAATIDIFTITPILTPYDIESYSLTTSDYSLETTQAGNRNELANYIFLECDDLETAYTDTGIILKTSSDSGIILSSWGDTYYQGVVEGITNLCPQLFFIQTSIPEVMEVTEYDLSMGDTIAARTDADDMGEGFTNMATLFHLNKYAFWLLITGIVTLIASIITVRKEWGVEPGFIIGGLVFSGLSFVVGGMIFGVLMLVSFVSVIGIVWIVILKRA